MRGYIPNISDLKSVSKIITQGAIVWVILGKHRREDDREGLGCIATDINYIRGFLTNNVMLVGDIIEYLVSSVESFINGMN